MTQTAAITQAAELTLDAAFPVERVDGQVAVATPRDLGPIEWALIAAAIAFDGVVDPVEMARELGLGDPVLVDDAADGLVELGAIERRDDGRLAVTEQGRARFAEGRVDGRPAWHGVRLVFDILTGDLVLADLGHSDAPCVAPEALAAPQRETLDREQAALDPAVAKLCEDDGRIVATRVITSQHALSPVRIGFAIQGETLTAVSVTPDLPEGGRLRFVRERGVDPVVLAPLAGALPFVDATPHDPQPLGPARARGAAPMKAIAGAIGAAKQTVLIHPALAAVGPVSAALSKAVRRGVTVVEWAPSDAAPAVVALDGGAAHVRVPARLSAAPAAVVIDGARALAVATRTLKASWDGSRIPTRSLDDFEGEPARRVLAALLDARVKRARPEPRDGAPTGLVVAWALKAVGAKNHRLTSHWAAAAEAPDADWAALWPFAPSEAAQDDLALAIAAQAGGAPPAWLARVRPLAARLTAAQRAVIGKALAAEVAPEHARFADAVPALQALLPPEALAEWAQAWCAALPEGDPEGWLAARLPLTEWAADLPAGPLLERLGHLQGLAAVERALGLRDALRAVGRDPAPVGPALAAALADDTPVAPPAAIYDHLSCPVLGPPLVGWAWRALPQPQVETFIEDLSVVLGELPKGAREPLALAAAKAHAEALRELKGGTAWELIQRGWKALGLRKDQLDRVVGKGSNPRKRKTNKKRK